MVGCSRPGKRREVVMYWRKKAVEKKRTEWQEGRKGSDANNKTTKNNTRKSERVVDFVLLRLSETRRT